MALDALQLWAQIYVLVAPLTYQDKSSCFRLTDDERAALAARNGEYEKPLKSQEEIEDILAIASEKNYPYRDITVSTFISWWPSLKPFTVQQVGAALSRCGIDVNRSKKERTRRLPVPKT